MGARRPNPKLVKIHRSYTVDEAAVVCGVHRHTIRLWLKNGLHAIDRRHPTVILGAVLAHYLRQRRAAKKRPCAPGELYCMRCREPKRPVGLEVEYRPMTTTQGNLVGLCPVCRSRMFRRVSLVKLAQVCGPLRVSVPQAQQHIDESPRPTVNSDFRQDNHDRDDAQP